MLWLLAGIVSIAFTVLIFFPAAWMASMVEKQTAPTRTYDPGNPLANKQGYVYQSNVNPIEEMANMISASRAFRNSVNTFNTAKQLLLATLKLGE